MQPPPAPTAASVRLGQPVPADALHAIERALQLRHFYALEQAIAGDPAAQRLIGVPRTLGKLLAPGAPANSLRTLRFNFHPTLTGWLLSEVNTDVPGGWWKPARCPPSSRRFKRRQRCRDVP